MRARVGLNVIAAAIAVAGAGWIAVTAMNDEVLPGLFVLHRGTAVPVPALSHPAVQPHAAETLAPAASTKPAALLIPVAGVQRDALVDTFTAARANGDRFHDAIDITAPAGTPVLAAAQGTVEKLFVSRDGGNTIYIRSPDRATIYYYAHLAGYAPDVVEGRVVRAGELLGWVGSSGNANPAGPHLHFAVWQVRADAPWYQQATALNPYPLLMGR